MKIFLKLNGLALLYGIGCWIPAELFVNVYRIQRIWKLQHTYLFIWLLVISAGLAGTRLVYALTKRWLGHTRLKYLLMLLWIPYFILLILGFAELYPIHDPAEVPLPAIGLVLIAWCMVYPFCIAAVNAAVDIRRSQA
ncbi:hypothetical protein F4V43_03230 [Paenibacillus spiritus]|uniref:Uncharacterized protein n=1 Tax=Paenibacillus spiritus TaxID=2496557 RepID=A0A5J5GH29_9BACL|nr:hypothetical protein [Paenibacillus spiritus]KAA9007516.1 hypothetical protein F4V43_03230 [Paenibacillus spiritus]